MRFSPYDRALAVLSGPPQGEAQRPNLRMHLSVDCMILPPEQKAGARVKARKASIDDISDTRKSSSFQKDRRENRPRSAFVQAGRARLVRRG